MSLDLVNKDLRLITGLARRAGRAGTGDRCRRPVRGGACAQGTGHATWLPDPFPARSCPRSGLADDPR